MHVFSGYKDFLGLRFKYDLCVFVVAKSIYNNIFVLLMSATFRLLLFLKIFCPANTIMYDESGAMLHLELGARKMKVTFISCQCICMYNLLFYFLYPYEVAEI